MEKYMVSTIHWLNADDAKDYSSANDPGYTDVIEEDDGTFSVVRLSDKPIQFGQAPYVGRKGTALVAKTESHT